MRLIRIAFALVLLAAALAAPGTVRAGPPEPTVRLGDDAFLASGWKALNGRCIGIVTNASGVTSTGENFVDAVRQNSHICVRALFAPEHGLRGDRPAGTYVASYTDAGTGLPVYSLYGATRHPSAAMLDGVDVLVFDIQDVGARPYTYVSTMAYVMQTAAQTGKEIWELGGTTGQIKASAVAGPDMLYVGSGGGPGGGGMGGGGGGMGGRAGPRRAPAAQPEHRAARHPGQPVS